ncbi:membrane protein insertase YidC [Nocardia callitridis]|uniref:Membrane protein insertase YidC n=1 Tax=Nocardia callitridis TaxID=648753 RepID=A0ABP9K7Z6_9NOCA
MLDIVYYPVSAVLWMWHTAFASLFGAAGGLAWVLSIVFLVVTVRAALLPAFLKQARTQVVLRRLRPKIAAVKQKYPDDRTKQATEVQRLHKENGVTTFATLIPMVGQVLVFLGLFHVLRSFDRTAVLGHLPFLATATPMSTEQNAATPNYLFGTVDVRSFLDAHLFGAPLASNILGGGGVAVSVVGGVLVVIAAVATHFTARIGLSRQDETTALPFMRTLSLWVFPVGALLAGAVMPVSILLYYAVNNAWTLAQQHLVSRRVDAEVADEDRRRAEVRAQAAPKPGAKPQRQRR